MIDEKKLLTGLKEKRKDAIEQAIEIYTPYLSAVLFNMMGTRLPKEDVEEIIADVFIALWKNAEYIDPSKGTIRSYIAAIARNGALKRLNRAVEHTSLEEIQIAEDDATVDDRLFGDDLWQAVMALGEPDSEIFVRYYKYDQKLKDIAKVMGLKISTVKTKLSRGRQRLKRILEESI